MKLVSGEDFKEVRMGTKIGNPADIQGLYFVSQHKQDKTCAIFQEFPENCVYLRTFQAQICELGILLKHLRRVKICFFSGELHLGPRSDTIPRFLEVQTFCAHFDSVSF